MKNKIYPYKAKNIVVNDCSDIPLEIIEDIKRDKDYEKYKSKCKKCSKGD